LKRRKKLHWRGYKRRAHNNNYLVMKKPEHGHYMGGKDDKIKKRIIKKNKHKHCPIISPAIAQEGT